MIGTTFQLLLSYGTNPQGFGIAHGFGSANGVAVAFGLGVGTANAGGQGTATGFSGVAGFALGAGAASAVGAAIASRNVTASGLGAASAVGLAQAVGIANASGSGTAQAVGAGIGFGIGVGNASGLGAATGFSGVAGVSSGLGTATAVGAALAPRTVSASGAGAANAVTGSTAQIVLTATGTVFSSGTINLGTADVSRIIVVAVASGSAAAPAVTLGGVSMSPIATNGRTIIYALARPTGTSDTLSLSTSNNNVMAAYALYGMSGVTAFATGTGSNAININVPANGVVITAFDSNNSVSFTAGVTSDATGTFCTVGHAGVFSTAQTPLAISGTGGGGSFQQMSAASWGP